MSKRRKEANLELTLADKKVVLFDNFIEQRPDFWLQWDQQDQESWNQHTKYFISECWMSLFYLVGGFSAHHFAKKQKQPPIRPKLYLFGFAAISAVNLFRGYSQTKRDVTDYLTKKYLIDETGKETGYWENNVAKPLENPGVQTPLPSSTRT